MIRLYSMFAVCQTACLVNPAHYLVWVEVSGGLWIVAFTAFSVALTPVLLSPRIDGRYG